MACSLLVQYVDGSGNVPKKMNTELGEEGYGGGGRRKPLTLMQIGADQAVSQAGLNKRFVKTSSAASASRNMPPCSQNHSGPTSIVPPQHPHATCISRHTAAAPRQRKAIRIALVESTTHRRGNSSRIARATS